MADEAFALSPISARPAQPSEADYDAIREAFMETSRGRWFLGEYAKRNRNADTLLVLDAVARIEETLATQKKPARDPMLDQALVAIRNALGEAKGATHAAIDQLSLEQNLSPIRKGARVIREIAWRLREIGADSRICDLIDSQVNAIDGAAAKMAPADLAGALSGVFDLIESRIAAFDADNNAGSFAAPPAEGAPPEVTETIPPADGAMEQDATAAATGDGASTHVPEPAEPPGPVVEAATGEEAVVQHVAGAASSAEAEPVDAFTSDDEAMLEMVATEMAAPDSDEAYLPPMGEMQGHEVGQVPSAPPPLPAVSPNDSAPAMEPMESFSADDIEMTFSSDEPSLIATASAPVESAPKADPALAASTAAPVQAIPPAEAGPSLGSSLLASGIVLRPKTPKVDPFAPIRRMTQSEKIAFFS